MTNSLINSKVNNLENILSKYFQDDIKVIEEKYSILTAPGEHYGSLMYAIETDVRYFDGKKEKLHLVAKIQPANEMLRQVFDVKVTFKKEVLAYSVSLPALLKFQRQHDISKDKLIDNLFAECYGARISLKEHADVVDEDAVLIFKNLKMQGYQTEDRMKGFDYDDVKVIVKDLALFHATAIAFKLLEPDEFKKRIQPSLVPHRSFDQMPPEVRQLFHESITETARSLEELSPYWSKVQEMCDRYALNPVIDQLPPNEPWGTMQHFDYWVSNIMLRKDSDGKPTGNKIVDLQLMRYLSAPRDLIFFLFSSVKNNVLDERFDEFVKIYYDSFIDTLGDFSLDLTPFSWEEFRKELNEMGPKEIYHVFIMLHPIFTQRDKILHTAEEFDPSDWTRRDVLGEKYKRKLKDTALSFVKRKWL